MRIGEGSKLKAEGSMLKSQGSSGSRLKARVFAADTQQALAWSIAKDKSGNRVLAEKMNIVDGKEVWLSLTRYVFFFGKLN